MAKKGFVSIIGSGIGGLCTGIRLLNEGYDVSIYEKNPIAGGCIHYTYFSDEKCHIDESASIAINPLTYEKIFRDLNKNPEDYYKVVKINNYYKIFTYTGKNFALNRNLVKTQENIKRYFPKDVHGYTKLIYDTSLRYYNAKENLLANSYLSINDTLSTKVFKSLGSINTLTSVDNYINEYVKAKELRQLILFQTLFMGISPYKLPNIYTAIAANTQIEGIYHIVGGLSSYIEGLKKLYLELGGNIYYNSKITKVLHKENKVKGILCNDKFIPVSNVVINSDYINSQRYLLERNEIRNFQLSCSTFIIHLKLKKTYSSLQVHNLYLNRNFKAEVKRIYTGKMPITPSLYIYYPSKIDDSFCNDNSYSVMNIMVRVPNLKERNINWTEDQCKKLYLICIKAISQIEELKEIEKDIEECTFTTPRDFEKNYGYYKGICYGIGHTFFQSLMFRPQVKDKKLQGLYYVGSSIHPGNGASIVMDCSRILISEF